MEEYTYWIDAIDRTQDPEHKEFLRKLLSEELNKNWD